MADFNTFVAEVRGPGSGAPVAYKPDASVLSTLESGNFVAWQTSTRTLVLFVRDGSVGKYVGISRDSAKTVLRLGNQAALQPDRISVYTTGIHNVLGKSGETYSHGDEVYMNGTDVTSVTKTAGTGGVKVGVVYLPDGTQKIGAVRVPILIDAYAVTQA